MGTRNAQDMADTVADGGMSMEAALHYHLTANHYPPVPAAMVPVCITAIELANDGEWDAEVHLPEHVMYKGRPAAPVHAIVEQHHLDCFLTIDEDWS